MGEGEISLSWEAGRAPAGKNLSPGDLTCIASWIPAQVPGTVAGALRAAGEWTEGRNLDDEEWWYRTGFEAAPGRYLLNLGGLATIADVWVDTTHVLRSENMFRSHEVVVPLEGEQHEILVRFAPLTPFLKPRKPRPRWRAYLVNNQGLRWIRTTLLGRMPEWTFQAVPVGPYRDLTLAPLPAQRIIREHLSARCGEDGSGEVELRFVIEGRKPESVSVGIGHPPGSRTDTTSTASVGLEPVGSNCWLATCTERFDHVELWWPRSHGPQPLYTIDAIIDGRSVHIGRVGFRTLSVDRSDGGFRLSVNGVPIFCRGAGWMPIDAVSLNDSQDDVDRTFELLAEGNCNMVRFVGTTVYPTADLLDRCDEDGILVWHDCMFAHMDPPTDEDFESDVLAELTQRFLVLQGRPSVAVICGSTEMEEQAAMLGLTRDDWTFPLFDVSVPALVEEILPSTPYVRSTPTGGDNPLSMNIGLSHYFGVGGFLQPLSDARRASVRFATECLMFATPPEPSSVEEGFGATFRAGHDPSWKKTIHRDTGRSSDTEDVVDYYKGQLFEVDPLRLRYAEADRNLDLSRATVVECMTATMTEFRRAGSTCDGAMLMAFRDLRIGAGFGVVDAFGVPKAPWFALRRVFDPIALLLTDEALNGLGIHVVNDTGHAFSASVVVSLIADGAIEVDRGERHLDVPARSGLSLSSDEFFDSFRDVTYSYKFARPAHDVVSVSLTAGIGDGGFERHEYFLPLGPRREHEHDVGLQASAKPAGDGSWDLEVSTERFAQYVAVDAPGFTPSDSWFHLGPNRTRKLRLTPSSASASDPSRPIGSVRALNSRAQARIAT